MGRGNDRGNFTSGSKAFSSAIKRAIYRHYASSLWFDFRDIYPLKWIVIDPLKWINADHTAGLLCTSTIPRVLGSLYVFMAIILIWVVFAWLVVHWRSCDKPTLTLEHMARLHYVQSELWFSIILLILSLNLGLALFSVFYLKCDTSIINTIKEFAVTPDKTWLVVFEHALPLLSLNGFALTSVVLGFLWARRGYQAHSHNNMIFEHKATYWAIIMTKPGKEASELLREVIRVSSSSGYEEGAQAIQLVGISAPPKP